MIAVSLCSLCCSRPRRPTRASNQASVSASCHPWDICIIHWTDKHWYCYQLQPFRVKSDGTSKIQSTLKWNLAPDLIAGLLSDPVCHLCLLPFLTHTRHTAIFHDLRSVVSRLISSNYEKKKFRQNINWYYTLSQYPPHPTLLDVILHVWFFLLWMLKVFLTGVDCFLH